MYACIHALLTATFRPVGPGWDKGKGERRRDEVNHAYRCKFFKWAADVKRGSVGKNDNDGDHGDKNKYE